MKILIKLSPILAMLIGIILLGSGAAGALFTYSNVARENIVTTGDSAIPNTPVRGIFTLKAQSDIIRTHTLNNTEGKTFAEMPRSIPQLDSEMNPVVDQDGKPVMTPNTARNAWFNATTLTTSLNLAILAYAFSGLVILLGLIMIWMGLIMKHFIKREAK